MDENKYHFVQEPGREYICPICRDFAIDPLVHGNEAYVFCRSCLEHSLEVKPQCPCCKAMPVSIGKDFVKPARLFLSVRERLEVHCPHKSDGCTAIMQLGKLNRHVEDDCIYAPMPCRWKGCGVSIARRLEAKHAGECPFRVVACQACGIELPWVNMQTHTSECPNSPYKCMCGEEVLRKDKDRHTKSCDCAVVECSVAGCTWKGTRKNARSHIQESIFEHLAILASLVDKQRTQMDSQSRLLAEQSDQLHRQQAEIVRLRTSLMEIQDEAIWKINNYRAELGAAEQALNNGATPTLSSPILVCRGVAFEMKACLAGQTLAGAGHLALFFGIRPQHFPSSGLPLSNLVVTVTVGSTVDTLEIITDEAFADQVKRSLARKSSDDFYGWFKFMTKAQMESYVVDDTLFIRIRVRL
ncbi:TNF receptor-associated factor 4 [Pelomyxa schiedti]|nr:TNF receptor-associated factor 4 [Pelomyxa schiedti]